MIAAVSTIRNEEDIIEFCLHHFLQQGVDFILVENNASTDNTLEIITKMSKDDDRIVIYNNEGEYHSSEALSFLAEEARQLGCEWVIPFDADELWGSANGLGSDLKNIDPKYAAIEFRFENFVQNKKYDKDNILSTMNYKVPSFANDIDIIQNRRSWIEAGPVIKFLVRTYDGIQIPAGSHTYSRSHMPYFFSEDFFAYHLPMRSYANLITRAENGKRLIDAGYDPGFGWQNQRFYSIMKENMLDKEFDANFEEDGKLTRRDGSVLILERSNYVSTQYDKFKRNREK
jgi:glycosyltransferase involved in cell wall biosynthesis